MRIKYGICKIGYKATYFVYKDATTGINTNESAEATTIYPNPIVDGRFTVNLSHFSNNESISITVTDVQGRVVSKQDVKQNSSLEMDAQAFSTGMYFVNISTSERTENYKVVKE